MFPVGLEQQIRTLPAVISLGLIPPVWFISTSPSSGGALADAAYPLRAGGGQRGTGCSCAMDASAGAWSAMSKHSTVRAEASRPAASSMLRAAGKDLAPAHIRNQFEQQAGIQPAECPRDANGGNRPGARHRFHADAAGRFGESAARGGR